MPNSIATPGYFIKRMRDAGFIVIRLFDKFTPEDSRKWMVCVNPSQESVIITCHNNFTEERDLIKFQLDDGNVKWPKNFYLNTSSINIVIQELKDKGVNTDNSDSVYYKPPTT